MIGSASGETDVTRCAPIIVDVSFACRPLYFVIMGPFKCYVMQMGVGGVSDFPEKSVTKV